MNRRLPLYLLLFFAAISLFVGVQSIPVYHLFHFNELEQLVLWQTRVPRTISLIIAGATSSVCGLIMQHSTQNKFVSPTTAGTMDSARLGMLVAMLFFPASSILTRSFVAFIFAFLGTVVFLQLVKRIPGRNQLMIPLVGVMFGNIIGSVVTFFAYQFQLIQNMTSWLQGSFSTITKGDYELLYLSVPVLLICYVFAYQFTLVGMGKDMATSVGLDYDKIQLLGLLLIALASSVTLVTVGGLPFIGVIIPNIVAQFYGDQLKNTLWLTAISGSLFLVVCDILSRVIYPPYEIPVSLIVGVIGSVVFIFLLWKGGKRA
ncbi:iron chelate uptake ABC transporter family permease subunit [Vagococcus sp. DIV0080]|uniref:Iron chelate uptake ABC transporter family permease subunit n=1 Tax=Candidatus Vagococcus giribetii TaxID=2230876 RepID=A0ABS3HTN5_9ENTE|nr:iron chelate uptake ABC transporter family permease subunit [Vagococcus sp. DIV0080]MBO0476597.1 iron chelate uptake ABC transporter family permease subunit [Vagococcus sp. DIV0080]